MYLAIPESFHSIIYGPGIPASSLSCLRHAALLLRTCHFSPAVAENSSGRICCCRLEQQINTTGRRFAIFFLFVRGYHPAPEGYSPCVVVLRSAISVRRLARSFRKGDGCLFDLSAHCGRRWTFLAALQQLHLSHTSLRQSAPVSFSCVWTEYKGDSCARTWWTLYSLVFCPRMSISQSLCG